MIYDVIIVGAGAAGLFCGANLKDKKYAIIDKSEKVGLKLLVSGSGQCNFTHGGDIKDFVNFYGENGKKIRGILFKFNNQMTWEYFQRKGVEIFEREDGKVFPKSLKAEDIRGVLLKEIAKNKGEILNKTNVCKIEKKEDLYYVKAEDFKGDKIQFCCKNLVIAIGGRSYKNTGSDGKLLDFIGNSEEFKNLSIIPQRPALVPVYVEDYRYECLSGISVKNAAISKGKIKSRGDVLFTHKNLSGPLILNFSRYLDAGDKFKINYIPDGFKDGEHLECNGVQKNILNYLMEQCDLAKGFLEKILEILNIDKSEKAASLKGGQVKAIENILRDQEFIVNGKASWDKAMVTAGGISLKEVSTGSLESKKHPRLYFIGEVLDVDGDTGGYNIQFAFSSGYKVAQHISQLP